MEIISQIFMKLPMTLNDDWMITDIGDAAGGVKPQISLRRQKNFQKDVREKCVRFNRTYSDHLISRHKTEFEVPTEFDYEGWLESEVFSEKMITVIYQRVIYQQRNNT
eukprot:TRINITY_DN13652_c0_g1_i1.p1 TRINITY_DN13652_c0_g1~~TRINITY_DN13652_c0_g1_i1.p1  ORF type:complete len:108 (-),score=13.81 TRINITY_DN13652_c0_g1_i1:104-427(-)